MKIMKRIRAFFTHQEEQVELDLIAAEIKEGKAFLHPRGEEHVTYLVRSDDIEITLSKGRSLGPKDIFRMGPKPKNPEKEKKEEEKKPQKQPPIKDPKGGNKKPVSKEITQTEPGEFDKFKKKKFVVSLYPEEYDAIMASMKEYGYKRADFVMACVNTATKGTMEKAHKKIVRSHNEMRKEQQEVYARQMSERR